MTSHYRNENVFFVRDHYTSIVFFFNGQIRIGSDNMLIHLELVCSYRPRESWWNVVNSPFTAVSIPRDNSSAGHQHGNRLIGGDSLSTVPELRKKNHKVFLNKCLNKKSNHNLGYANAKERDLTFVSYNWAVSMDFLYLLHFGTRRESTDEWRQIQFFACLTSVKYETSGSRRERGSSRSATGLFACVPPNSGVNVHGAWTSYTLPEALRNFPLPCVTPCWQSPNVFCWALWGGKTRVNYSPEFQSKLLYLFTWRMQTFKWHFN